MGATVSTLSLACWWEKLQLCSNGCRSRGRGVGDGQLYGGSILTTHSGTTVCGHCSRGFNGRFDNKLRFCLTERSVSTLPGVQAGMECGAHCDVGGRGQESESDRGPGQHYGAPMKLEGLSRSSPRRRKSTQPSVVDRLAPIRGMRRAPVESF